VQPATTPRAVVLDTNIALDLLVFRDPGVQELRDALDAGTLRWLGLAGMRDELHRVLGYPRVAAGLRTRALEPAGVLAAYDAACRVCAEVARAPVRCSDPDDQPFIDLALAHGAILISKDRAVLATRRRLAPLGVAVSQRFVTNRSDP
jgi:predicted nucleic acid-binding protein